MIYFEFNIYSSLLLSPFIQGILFSILLLVRYNREKTISDVFLAVLIFIITLKVSFWMLGFAGWYDTHDSYTSFMFYFPFNLILLTGPLAYFYFLTLSNATFRFTKKHLIHLLIPFFVLCFFVLKFAIDFIFYYPFPKSALYQYGTKGPYAELDKSDFFNLFSIAYILWYMYFTIRVFKGYKQYIQQNFSSLHNIHFKWLENLFWALSIGLTIFFLFYITDAFIYAMSYKLYWYAYFVLGMVIYYVSLNGYYTSADTIRKLNFVLVKPVQESQTDSDSWKEKLETLMITEEPYLNPDITLVELAKMLGTNTSTLSNTINARFDQNFNDFINQFRVKEVLKKLKAGEYTSQTIISIAYDSGFNSKTTFNRAFKKYMNKTPLEYIKELN